MPTVQVGGAVRAGSLYLSRAADEALFETLRAGEIAYVLAPRQMGKTSLLHRTRERLGAVGVRHASVDLSGLGLEVADPDAWYLSLADELGAELALPEPDAFFASKTRPSVARLGSWLRGALAQDSSDLVVFIDEVDALLRNPALAGELLALLRSVWERNAPAGPRLTFCLLGVAAPWELVLDPTTTPFNVGREVTLEDFSRAELVAMEGALEGERSGEILDAVVELTGGHPYMTARLVTSMSPDASVSDVEACAQRLYFDADGDVTLTASERAMLAGPASLLELYGAALRDGRARAASPELARAALLTGMLARTEGGLRARNAIYRRVFDAEWVARQMRDRPFGVAVDRWISGDRAQADLLRGAALADLQAWAGEATLTSEEQALLVQSVGAARREEVDAAKGRARRRNQRILWATVVLLSVALALVGLALRGEKRALERAEALAAASRAELLLAAPKRELDALSAAVRATSFREDDGEPLPEARHALAATVDALASEVRPGLGLPLSTVGCSPDGRRAAAWTRDGRVIGWDLAGFGPTMLDAAPSWLPLPSRLPHGEVHTRSGTVRADSEGESGDIHLSQVGTDHPIGRLSGAQSEATTSLRFDPRGGTLLSLSDDDTAVLWSVQGLRVLRHFGAIPTTPRDAAFCGAGSRALLVGDDGALRVWHLHGAAVESQRGPDGGVTWAGWDARGSLWMTSARGGIYVRETGSRFEVRARGLAGHAWMVLGAGVALASDEEGQSLLLRSDGSSEPVDGWARRRERAVTPDGTIAVLLRDAEVASIDVGTGRTLRNFAPHRARLETASLSPDGALLATGDVEGEVCVWELASGVLRWRAPHRPGPIYSGVWSPDGTRLLTHGRVDEVRVWDAVTGEVLVKYVGHHGTTNMARFSDDGTRVITTGFADNTAQIWNPLDGQPVALLQGHRARVRVADLDPSGVLAATAGDDGTVRVWDARSGAALATFGGLEGPVRHLEISPEGDRVLAVSDDGWLRIYPLDWRVLRRRACAMLPEPPPECGER